MNETETRIAEKLAEQVPALNADRLEKLGQIMELTALVASVYAQISEDGSQREEVKP